MNIETLLAFGIGLSIGRFILLALLVILVIVLVKQVFKLVRFVFHLPIAALECICKHFDKEERKKVSKKNRK